MGIFNKRNEKKSVEMTGLGINLLEEKQFGLALQCFNEAIKADPKYLNPWLGKAGALKELGRYSEAIECCNKVLEISPDHYTAKEVLRNLKGRM